MDQNLQRLIGELRKEVCPGRVVDEVARSISSQRLAHRPFRYGLASATATFLIVCGFVAWQWPERQHPNARLQLARQATIDRAQVIAQAEGALGYMGTYLLRAGARCERALNKEALPQLQNRFETTTDKIIQLLNQ